MRGKLDPEINFLKWNAEGIAYCIFAAIENVIRMYAA